jgi:hypothetical protein
MASIRECISTLFGSYFKKGVKTAETKRQGFAPGISKMLHVSLIVKNGPHALDIIHA